MAEIDKTQTLGDDCYWDGICGHCNGDLNEPRLLPCQHLACYKCLGALMGKRERMVAGRSLKVKCPTCGTKHTFKDISEFPLSGPDPPCGRCDRHGEEPVEKICESHSVPLCTLCALAHDECQHFEIQLWRPKLRQLKELAISLGEEHVIATCHALEASYKNYAATKEKFNSLHLLANRSCDETEIAKVADELQKSTDRFKKHAACLSNNERRMEDLVLAGMEELLGSSVDDLVSSLCSMCTLSNKIKLAMSELEGAAVPWRSPFGYSVSDGRLVMTPVPTNDVGPVPTTKANEPRRLFEFLKELQKDLECQDLKLPSTRLTVETLLKYKDQLAGKATKKEPSRPAPAKTSGHAMALIDGKVLEEHKQKHGQKQQQAQKLNELQHEHLSKQGTHADALRRRRQGENEQKQNKEHVLTQGQRADELRRQRAEKQQQEKDKLLQARKDEEERQAEIRRKAREAKGLQRQETLQQQEKMQADLERQREKQKVEQTRRQEIRQELDSQQQQKQESVRKDKQQQLAKLRGEQQSIMEDFVRQQESEKGHHQANLVERGAHQNTIRKEEEDVVMQVLHRQQEKHKQQQEAHHELHQTEFEQSEHQKKQEEKKAYQQQLVHQQHESILKQDEKARQSLQSKSRKHNAEELAEYGRKQSELALQTQEGKRRALQESQSRDTDRRASEDQGATDRKKEMLRKQHEEDHARVQEIEMKKQKRQASLRQQQQEQCLATEPNGNKTSWSEKQKQQRQMLLDRKAEEEHNLHQQLEKSREERQGTLRKQVEGEAEQQEQVEPVLKRQGSVS